MADTAVNQIEDMEAIAIEDPDKGEMGITPVGNMNEDDVDLVVPEDSEELEDKPAEVDAEAEEGLNSNEIYLVDHEHWIFKDSREPHEKNFRKINGKKCSMPGCNRNAYALCNSSLNWLNLPCLPPIWNGCGRNLCDLHISISYNKLSG